MVFSARRWRSGRSLTLQKPVFWRKLDSALAKLLLRYNLRITSPLSPERNCQWVFSNCFDPF
jgi:hypothetical protein